MRTGVRDIAVSKGPGFGGPKWVAKISPIMLRTSKSMRLERVYKGSRYREQTKTLNLALQNVGGLAEAVGDALRDLVPEE